MLYCPVTSKVYMLASNRLDENHNRLRSVLAPPPSLNLWNLLLGYLQRCRSIYKVNAADLMRHWTSLNAFADETGVEAVWLSLVLQIICAYWRCHSNQTETGVCARVCVLLWGYFPRWLRKSALWFIGAEEPCGYSSHARGDACLSAITASAHYVLIVATSSVLYKQKTAYFLVFAVVRVLCCFACQSDDVGLKNMFALL